MRLHSTAGKPRAKKGVLLPVAPTFGKPAVHEKPHRAPQETEGYIELYYHSRIATHVEQRAIEDGHHGPKINLIRQLAREMYAKEDEETREAVMVHVAAQAEKQHAKYKTLVEAEGAAHPTPEEYQQ